MALAQLSGAVVNDGINGKNNIILSDTEPIEPVVGQLWQNTSSTPEIVKEWDGSDWVMWGLYAPNINVDTLSALAISTGALTNVYETDHPTYGKHNGTVKINNDGFTIEDVATLSDGKFKGTKVDITGSTQGITGIFMQEIPDITVPTKFKQVWYMPDGTYFTDNINNYVGSITAKTLSNSPWINLALRNGYTDSDNQPPQYRLEPTLWGTTMVRFRGLVRQTSGNFAAGSAPIIADLPSTIRPKTTSALAQVAINAPGGSLMRAYSDGRILVSPSASTYWIAFDGLIYEI